ncbi:hypothetical protein [Micromonospora sp. NPDC005324]|uniref:hypothetical protein n=1 Tax=Micromonospora sp. NPDC005324 TaxID=3157033 RepID=UPI0033B89750
MRILGAASVVLSILIVVWGAVEVATGGESGVRMIVIGGICAAVTAIVIPLAIRRGRLWVRGMAPSRRAMQIRGVLVILVAIVVALGSTLMIVHADGSLTAYLVGGVLLLLALYAVASALLRWKQATNVPR